MVVGGYGDLDSAFAGGMVEGSGDGYGVALVGGVVVSGESDIRGRGVGRVSVVIDDDEVDRSLCSSGRGISRMLLFRRSRQVRRFRRLWR